MSLCRDIVDNYSATFGASVDCHRLSNNSVLMGLPLYFSDGDGVQIVATATDDTLRLSDVGASLSRLELSGVNTASPRVRERLRSVLRGFEVEKIDGQLLVSGPLGDSADMVTRLISAMLQVDALQSLKGGGKRAGFADQTITYFQSQFEYVEERPTQIGGSGTAYKLTAAVGEQRDPVFIHSISGGESQAGQRSADRTFRIFSDIREVPIQRKLVLIDDQRSNWRREDIRLLSGVSYIGSWKERDRVVGFIRSKGQGYESRILSAGQLEIL